MAKLETILTGSFDEWLERIESGILHGSITADLEDSSDFFSEDGMSRCSVRVFEKYGIVGSNRVSLSVTLFQGADGLIHCSAISSGGSQAMFFKINTFDEALFLDKLEDLLV